MKVTPLAVLDIGRVTRTATTCTNLSLASVNDHVVKVSVMPEPNR